MVDLEERESKTNRRSRKGRRRIRRKSIVGEGR